MSKRKGVNAERELFHMFWQNGWACSRIAGSGSNQYPSPDLLAGNGGRLLAIECKFTKNNRVYLPIKRAKALADYSRKIGAECWLAVRFSEWYFFSLEDLNLTKKSLVINRDVLRNKGIFFEDLIKR
ncbi:Holliday junction resolvase [Candidatus Woesearchaeota archaeon]|nr:MAG: Holliday junction resolvase [Candidatus Woesearchaeota archaeon]